MAPKLYVMYVSAPCRTVLMVAKAIGLDLELEEKDKEDLRTPEMLELNPQHTVPILVDEDDFVLWDSHAISGYIVGKYAEDDSLYPKDDLKKRAIIDQRLHFENDVLFARCKAAAMPLMLLGETEVPEEDNDKLLEAFGFLEAFLGDNEWMTGDTISIADLSILSTLATIELLLPLDADRFPKLVEWLSRCKELPYFDECNQEGLKGFKNLMPFENAEES